MTSPQSPHPETTSSHLFDQDEAIYEAAYMRGEKQVHYCPDWDFMPIWLGCPEMSGCTCYLSLEEPGE